MNIKLPYNNQKDVTKLTHAQVLGNVIVHCILSTAYTILQIYLRYRMKKRKEITVVSFLLGAETSIQGCVGVMNQTKLSYGEVPTLILFYIISDSKDNPFIYLVKKINRLLCSFVF